MVKKSEAGELHVSTESIVRAVLVIVGFWLLWYLRDILLIVLTAVILASVVEPAVQFFSRKNIPRLVALVAIYVTGAVVLAGLFYFFIPAILGDLAKFSRALPATIDLGTFHETLSGNESPSDFLARTVTSGATELSAGIREGANVIDLIKKGIEQEGALNTLSSIFGGFLSAMFIVVFSFYLAAQERGIESFLRLISPRASRGYVVDLWKRSQVKIGLWFQGQLVLGVLVGVLTFLALSILGLSSALLLAVLIMVFELIPVFGPIMAAVPAVLIAFTEGIHPAAEAFAVEPGVTAAIIIGVVYFFIQQIESQVLHPQVVRRVTGIPPVLVILSLVIGAKLAGFLGMLLAVPITAVLMEFLTDIARERKIFDDA
jgi:predicted PurR-regulated permease PerM